MTLSPIIKEVKFVIPKTDHTLPSGLVQSEHDVELNVKFFRLAQFLNAFCPINLTLGTIV